MHRRYEIRHGGRIQSTVRVASSVLNIRSLGRHTVADNTGEELAAFVAAVEKIIGFDDERGQDSMGRSKRVSNQLTRWHWRLRWRCWLQVSRLQQPARPLPAGRLLPVAEKRRVRVDGVERGHLVGAADAGPQGNFHFQRMGSKKSLTYKSSKI